MPKAKDRTLLTVTVTPAQREAIRRLQGGSNLSDYIRGLVAADAVQRGVEWPDDLNPSGVRLDYLARRLEDTYISVANGRAAVARTVGSTTVYAKNWHHLEDEAVTAVEAQGGHVTLSGIYECPSDLAARAKF